jgi:hypothetical protein
LPKMPANPELRADWRGLVSIGGAMVLFLSGVSHAVNGLSSPEFLAPTLSGVVLFGVHGLIEQRRQQPIFPISLYQRGCFSAAIVSGIAFNFAWAVVQLQTSNFWQLVQRYSTGQVALAQLPLLVSAGVGVVVAGRVMRPGRRITQLVAAGMASLVIGLLLFGLVRANSSYSSLGFAMVLVGIGLGLISVPQAALFVQEAPPRSLGSVTAFRTTAGQLGFALGAMVNGFGFASLRDRMLQLGSTPVQSHQLESLLREALSGGGLSQHSAAASNAIQVMSEAYASGLAGTMVGVAVIVGLLGAISLLLLVIGHRQQRL